MDLVCTNSRFSFTYEALGSDISNFPPGAFQADAFGIRFQGSQFK